MYARNFPLRKIAKKSKKPNVIDGIFARPIIDRSKIVRKNLIFALISFIKNEFLTD